MVEDNNKRVNVNLRLFHYIMGVDAGGRGSVSLTTVSICVYVCVYVYMSCVTTLSHRWSFTFILTLTHFPFASNNTIHI